MVNTNIVHYYTKRAGCDEYRILIRMNIRKYLDEKMIQMNIQTELDSHEEIELTHNIRVWESRSLKFHVIAGSPRGALCNPPNLVSWAGLIL